MNMSEGLLYSEVQVRFKLNKFEHVWVGPCTVRSKLNKFEYAWVVLYRRTGARDWGQGCEQNDRHDCKHRLPATSLAGGNKVEVDCKRSIISQQELATHFNVFTCTKHFRFKSVSIRNSFGRLLKCFLNVEFIYTY